jgi:hypothetical protein
MRHKNSISSTNLNNNTERFQTKDAYYQIGNKSNQLLTPIQSNEIILTQKRSSHDT